MEESLKSLYRKGVYDLMLLYKELSTHYYRVLSLRNQENSAKLFLDNASRHLKKRIFHTEWAN